MLRSRSSHCERQRWDLDIFQERFWQLGCLRTPRLRDSRFSHLPAIKVDRQVTPMQRLSRFVSWVRSSIGLLLMSDNSAGPLRMETRKARNLMLVYESRKTWVANKNLTSSANTDATTSRAFQADRERNPPHR